MDDGIALDPVAVWARLIRVQEGLLDKVEREIRQAGFPPLKWYDVLLELSRVPDGRLRYGDLQGRLLSAKHNLARLLDRLEADGLVAREKVEEDGRGACIVWKSAGRARRGRM